MISSIWSKLWKNCFSSSCILTLTIIISEMGVNCLPCDPLSQQKCDSVIGFNFHSLNYKQRTDIFHCQPTFILFVLFLTFLMKLFLNRAFVGLEDNIRNKLNSTQRLFHSKLMTSSDKFYSLGGYCLKVSTSFKMVSFVLLKRFRFQP